MVDDFSLAETWVNDVVVVALTGDLDMVTAPEARKAIGLADRQDSAALIVDLTGVTFLSVAGVNLLVGASRETAAGKRFGVVADSPATIRPLKLMGIDKVIAIHRTLGGALVDPA